MPRPQRCSACFELGHNARSCAQRLPDDKRRCACGDIYTPTTARQTRCPPCRRAYRKLRDYALEETAS